MKYAAISPRFIDSSLYLSHTQESPLVVIDGGSRGGVFDPFDAVTCPLEVAAFDPDEEAPRIQPSGNVRIRYIPRALWKDSGGVQVHIARQPATSSVYPPDLELLGSFNDVIGAPPRTTARRIEIASISIDEAADEGMVAPPDFIKLDIHSAEYEALEGASRSLDHAFGVLVESWHSPIHKGQHLTGELEHLLNRKGFHLFHLLHNSPWKHVVEGRDLELDRARLVGTESLFFREDVGPAAANETSAFHALALADLFGYNRFAVILSRRFAATGLVPTGLQKEIEVELDRIAEARLKRTRVQRFFKRKFRGLVRRLLS